MGTVLLQHRQANRQAGHLRPLDCGQHRGHRAVGLGAGLRIVALAQPFWAVLLVYAGALRGTGNTRFPLIATGGALWLSVGLAYGLLASVGDGLIAVWAAFLAIAPAQAVIYSR